MPPATEERRVPVLIVGGGIAGLSAAWWLHRNGHRDFRLLELESQTGGNARYGENSVSAFPWGAHYLPLPGPELPWVRLLLAELGVLFGDPDATNPRYEERHLCFAPRERLFLHGAWQDGILPKRGTGSRDREQYQRFFARMDELRRQHGGDGRRVFSLPMEESSRDPAWLSLDQGSMQEWLIEQDYNSPYLHWYVNYACRDDFGCDYRQTSAWAGLHYFASRTGSGEDIQGGTVLTWPEGNGWIAHRLHERLDAWISPRQMVFQIAETPDEAIVDAYVPDEKRVIRWRTEHVVWAAPTSLLSHVWITQPNPLQQAARRFDYAPWLVANLTLSDFPKAWGGAPLSWDNVLYQSRALGYVVATHQAWNSHQSGTIFTYYYPLSEYHPSVGRRLLSGRNWHDWKEAILTDLSRPHPDLRGLTSNLDIFRWGHAMIRPTPGFLWGGERQTLVETKGRIHPAHSDLSGFSLFEEAQYRGIVAAMKILALG